MLLSIMVFAAALPFARMPLPEMGAFIPSYQSAVVIGEVITAALLFGQFSTSRARPLLILASGYLFTALMTIAHLLSFPGVFSQTGLLGPSPQITAWLFLIWHAGFPVAVIGYARLGATRIADGPSRKQVVASMAGVFALAVAATAFVTVAQDDLPSLLRGIRRSDWPLLPFVVAMVWAIGFVALAVLWWRRPHSLLDVWLMAALCAWVCDVGLSSVVNNGRWDLGFYLGRVFGLLATCLVLLVLLLETSIGGERQAQRRQAFLLKLSDALREASDAETAIKAASRLLGEELKASRVVFAEIDEAAGTANIRPGWMVDGTEVHPAVLKLSEFGGPLLDDLRAGRTVRYDDVGTLPYTRPDLQALAAIGIRAELSVPLLEAGRFVVNINVHQHEPRTWTDDEAALTESVAERLWDAVQRARAEAALRGSEEKYRTLFESIDEGFCVIERLETAPGEPSDYRYVLANPAFGRHTGLGDPVGLTIRQLVPEAEQTIMDIYDRVVRTGLAERFENHVAALDLWMEAEVFPADAPGRIAVLFSNVSERKRAEIALRESEERFRTLAETIEDVLYVTDIERRTLEYLSPSYERVWGRPAAELEADLSRFVETIHPDDRAAFAEGKAAQERGEPVATSYRIVRPDGAVRHVFDRSFPVAGAARRRTAGVASDVTERVHAESALRESEERLRQFGEASSDVLWIRDAASLGWQYLTPAFEHIYGLDRGEALSGNNFRGWIELIVPEDRERVLEEIRRVRAGERAIFEYRVRRPVDGEIRWLRNTDFPIFDETGRVARIGGIGHDVTELKATEAALASAEARQRALLEGIPQLVWRAVDGGDWTGASPQWSAYTGLSEQASLGRGWLDALHPDDRERALDAWREAERSGVLEVEYRVRHAAEDRRRWFSTRAAAVRDASGGIIEWLGTSTDIDDLRRLQGEQQVMVAELQHRTRNLIAVVRSIAQQTMAATGPTEAFRDELNHRLEALARVQSLLSHADEAPITLEALIRMELDALGATRDGADPIALDGPPVRIRHSVVQTLALALHELATNARKYGALSADAGRLSVSWRVRDADGEGRRLVLDWAETGGQPPRESADAGRGYGRELIERALPYSLGAKTMYEHDAAGVRCTIDMPLDKKERRRRPR